MAEVAMAEAAAMEAVSVVVDTALGVEVSEVFPSFSHRLLRRSTRRPRRPSSCRPHSRPGAEVEEREERWQQERREVLAEVQRLKEEAGRMVAILAMEAEEENLSQEKKISLGQEVGQVVQDMLGYVSLL